MEPFDLNSEIIAGDRLVFTVSVPEYSAADAWTLKYRLVPTFTTPVQAPITIVATTNVDGIRYDIDEAPATTADYEPGIYTWSRWVEKSGDRQILDVDMQLIIREDPAQAAQGYDGRSWARKALENLQAWIAGDRSQGVASYSIRDRQIQYMTTSEIEQAMSWLRWEVAREIAADRAAKGLGVPGPIQVRFGAKGS